MGLFLSSIQSQTSVTEIEKQPYWSEPLIQVKEYHGIFKSVCETFIINTEEFKEIFGSLEHIKIWDPDSTGKIDALQLFSGLIIFAKDCTFRNKLSFLFSIFDFNEIKSISFVDLEVMVISLCNSIYKIQKKNAKANQPEISEWLEKGFSKRQRIKITRLFNFLLVSEQMQAFFQSLNQSSEFSTPCYQKLKKQIKESEKYFTLQNLKKIKKKKDDENEIKQNLEWHQIIYDKIVKVEKTEEEKNLSYECDINWVYGMNEPSLCRPFIFISDYQILYISSSMGVIYNIEQNEQRIYKQHKKTIKCMTYNRTKQILVTAEVQQFPRIHFWSKQLQNIIIIESFHRQGISMMDFVLDDQMLITIGNRDDSPILIYSMQDYKIKYKILLKDVAKAILSPLMMIAESSLDKRATRMFAIYSDTKVYQISLHEAIQSYQINELGTYEQNDKITCGCAAYMNISNPYISSYRIKFSEGFVVITGHQSGNVRMVSDHEKYSSDLLINLSYRVVCIQITCDIIAIASSSRINLYEMDTLLSSKEKSQFQSLEIGKENLKLISPKIKYFGCLQKYYLVMTESGDFVKIQSPQLCFFSSTQNRYQNSRKQKLQTLFLFKGNCNKFCLLERQPDNELILCSIHNNKVFGIDSVTHIIEDFWEINEPGESITAIDAVYSDEGVCYVICGCESGKLYITIDWEESPKHYDCGSKVIEVKISRDCSYLLVITQDNYILFFSQNNRNFISPRKLLFQNQVPICVNFLDNFKYFIATTSAKNSYIIEIPQLKHKNLQKEGQKISIQKMDIRYPSESNKKQLTSCSIIGGNLNFSILVSKEGVIYFYKNSQNILLGNYRILDVHHCSISQILLNEQQSRYYSLGSEDKALVEWKVFKSDQVQNNVRDLKSSRVEEKERKKKQNDLFQKMKELSINRKLVSIPSVEYELYFKGTKIQALNQCLYRNSGRLFDTIEDGQNSENLQKRSPNISLNIAHVYGIQNTNKSSLYYYNNGTNILSFTSKFITLLNIQTKSQKVYEPTQHKISCLTLTPQSQILYCTVSENPSIYILFKDQIPTTHTKGIIHLTIHKQFVLSYGISNEGYSINYHNYKTKQLLYRSICQFQISQFIFINERTFVSLNEMRFWNCFCPSPKLMDASSAALLPNKQDMIIGAYNGDLLILSNHKIHMIYNKAHEKEIDFIAVRNQNKEGFELVTVGREERIKIWNNIFECKIMIPFREGLNFTYIEESLKNVQYLQTIRALSMAVNKDKILLYFNMGMVYQIQTFNKDKKKFNDDSSSQLNMTQKNMNESKNSEQSENKEKFCYKWDLIIENNINKNTNFFSKKILFSVHPNFAIMASSVSDSILIIKDYNHNEVLVRYLFDDKEIASLKFSPNGKILVVGFNTGQIRLYEVKLMNLHKKSTLLKFCQVFNPKVSSIIINIQFSQCSSLFAVSHISKQSLDETQKENSKKESFVQIFKTKSNLLNQSTSQAQYYIQIDCIQNRGEIKQTNKYIKAIYYMSFILKDEEKSYLVLYEQYFNQNKIRINNDNKGKYKVYNIEEKVFIKNQYSLNWSQVDFPNSINILQVKNKNEYFEYGLKNPNLFNEEHIEQEIIVTAMKKIDNYLVYGMNNGRLHLVKDNSLFCEKPISQYEKQQMNLSKIYPSQTSFINKIQVSHDKEYLFVSGVLDECIIKYKITDDTQNNDIENTEYSIDMVDQHKQYLHKTQFNRFMNDVIPIRDQIQEIIMDVQKGSEENGSKLEMVKIFGRRAFDRRNNIYHNQHTIIYTLGPNIIIQDPEDPFNQSIITHHHVTNSPQISAFNFNNNYLIAATEEEKSKIFIWDILSKTCLCQMNISFSIVYHIAQSTNKKIILIYGINSNYEANMQLIDWEKKKVLGNTNLIYSGHWKIKDICEINHINNQLQFVSCGVQHLCAWQYKSNSLTHSSFVNSFSSVTFMVVRCFKDLIVGGCESGYLYIWKDRSIVAWTQVHTATIRTILIDDDYIYSGGIDGTVVMSSVGFNEMQVSLQTQNKIYLSKSIGEKDEETQFQTQYDIQSLTMWKKEKILYIGTRSGSIYSYSLKEKKDKKQILYSHDNEDIASFCFDGDNPDIFYMLTLSGTIQVWQLKTLERLFTFQLNQKCQKVYSFNGYLMVCCERKIKTMKINYKEKSLQYEQELSQQYDGIITYCILSKHQISNTYYLAISIKKNQTNEIIINEVKDEIKFLSSVMNLKYKIQYMDFSTDLRYLLFKDNFEELGMINLENSKRINTIFVQMNIEWSSQGLRISPQGQKIYYSYSRENKITAIERLTERQIIVGDQMGTIRIFEYPCSQDRIGQLHTSCYTHHMNMVNNIRVGHNQEYVLTNSSYDKSVILWKRTNT